MVLRTRSVHPPRDCRMSVSVVLFGKQKPLSESSTVASTSFAFVCSTNYQPSVHVASVSIAIALCVRGHTFTILQTVAAQHARTRKLAHIFARILSTIKSNQHVIRSTICVARTRIDKVAALLHAVRATADTQFLYPVSQTTARELQTSHVYDPDNILIV